MPCQCFQPDNDSIDLTLIEHLLKSYNSEHSNLITLLQTIQGVYGYLPQNALEAVSIHTGIKEAKVYGVATFYSQFRMAPIGKYLILLCQGTACYVNGSALIESAIIEHLGIMPGETTVDGLFTFTNVACLGCCSLAPVMMINDQTYANLAPEKIESIFRKLKLKEES